jgi:phasin family protein
MAKTKTAQTTKDTAEATFRNGVETAREGFERAAKGFDHLATFNRHNIEAFIRSANVAAKGFELINTEILTFSRQALEDSVAATKAVMSSKSLQEAVEVQSDFAKTAFDTYVGQVSKMGDIVQTVTRGAFEPFNDRVKAMVELVQTPRA